MIRQPLTNRERQIYEYLKEYYKKHCYAPSFREIGKTVGLKSTASIHAHMNALQKKGYIETDAEFNTARAFRITGMKVFFTNEMR